MQNRSPLITLSPLKKCIYHFKCTFLNLFHKTDILTKFGLFAPILKKQTITIQLDDEKLNYQLFTTSKEPEKQGEIYYSHKNEDSIEVALSQLNKHLNPKTKDYSTWSILVSQHDIQQAELKLPKQKLSEDEILLYVTASIPKLFNRSSSPILFDYYLLEKDKISVTVCNKTEISELIDLFAKLHLNLQFMGLILPDEQKINFLPWRSINKKRNKIQLISFILVFGLFSLLFIIYLWLKTENRIGFYSDQIIMQQNQILMATITQPITLSASQIQLPQLFIAIADALPQTIGLIELHYELQKIVLVGYSYHYHEITDFTHDLCKVPMIENIKIQTINSDLDGLKFELLINLKN